MGEIQTKMLPATHAVSVSLDVFVAVSNTGYANNLPKFSSVLTSPIQCLGHSLSPRKAPRSNPHPTFTCCMQNESQQCYFAGVVTAKNTSVYYESFLDTSIHSTLNCNLLMRTKKVLYFLVF